MATFKSPGTMHAGSFVWFYWYTYTGAEPSLKLFITPPAMATSKYLLRLSTAALAQHRCSGPL